ncbi:hypothetical protein SCHPADRAFT_921956 [Schizopora paradoxa]|uniref:PQ-loop-domain-containing protein n=1 Tax=Schizopora paradoxa TaxID=27342 RepID=A0A0H2S120_9AGAM|nr:hypothetical protein SCHPADRAFT_921956 [Schizopora paradoxa]
MGSEWLSGLFGWVSIGCWLGAQFPQVLENIKRQSCEGLAMPFLLNWLLGDITNLVGCILTHQLPFQTILASYFCSVDMMLFSQYFYYRSKTKAEHGVAPRRASQIRRHTTEHEHYRQLSAAAANVAAAAAMAASEEDVYSPQRVHSWRSVDDAELTKSEAAEAEDEVDEAALIALADSFHSESGRKHVSWSQERLVSGGSQLGRGGSRSRTRQGPALTMSPFPTRRDILHSPDQEQLFIDPEVSGGRGRPLQRQVIDSPIDALGLDLESQETIHIRPTRERKESRASRKSAALVFLGVWALFGIGSVARSRLGGREVGGYVMEHDTPLSLSIPSNANYIDGPNRMSTLLFGEEPSTERILGRLSAWMCTTLYLTSRLPQIWKNYVRKSVEGLSMFLFVFAFLGNTFYVLSILTSPKLDAPHSEAMAFLIESVPYLLGSGGTLLFDVTIVTQSFLYKPGRKPLHQRTRSQSHSHARGSSHHHPHGSSYSRGGSAARIPRSNSSTGTFGGDASDAVEVLSSSDAHARRRRDGTLESADT